MDKKLTLAVDMDEVLSDTGKKLKERYYAEFGVRLSEEALQGKDTREVIPEEHLAKYRSYLDEPGFFLDLALMPDAVEVLQQLNEKYELYIVSAALEFPNSLKDKYDWLQRYFPFITWQQICFCGLKYLVQTDIIIDDRSRNFKYFKGRKILFSAHHNILETAYERADNWKEVAEKLL